MDTTSGEILRDRPEPRELASLLVEHLNGRTHAELSRELHQLLEAVTAHGKKGSLVIAINIDPTSAGEHTPVAISFESTVKAPKAKAASALFFIDSDGNPTQDNPSQPSLFARPVPSQSTELRNV
ncbi:hypothetical protein ACEZCY_13955 [Streptacidiphilus sp. N1-12]|uniref:Uncharacterized protein n=2 Tax=Streptacidiphilus alkalitolerans TaxID=3342712 RepID=A0ABV6V9N9_9ACTN